MNYPETQPDPLPTAHGSDWDEDCTNEDTVTCGMCGDDGWIMLSDAGPSEWGEDCFCEIDRPIECPECRERRIYEARRRAKASPNDQAERRRP